MKFVTVATADNGYYPSLRHSCREHGCDLTVLGWQQPWKGFAWRFELLLEYLRQQKTDEIVAVIDAYDVIILSPSRVIEERFLEAKVPVLFSVDRTIESSPISTRLLTWYIHRKKYPFASGIDVCAGMYMGYAKDLIELITIVRAIDGGGDDQRMFALMTRTYPERFHLDKDNRIFLNYYGDYDEPEKKNICILHGPGNVDLDGPVERLGLDKPNHRISKTQYALRLLPSTIHWFKWEILLILVVIAAVIHRILSMFG